MASVAIESQGNGNGSEKKVDEIGKFVNSRFITVSAPGILENLWF